MKIAILGFGLEGKALLKFFRKSPIYKNAEIVICDRDADLKKMPANIGLSAGKNYLKNLGKFDVVFRSPGVPYNLPEIQKAVKAGVKFSGNIQLFFEEAEKIDCQIIGVTGTKGKGTVSTLLYKIFKAAGRDAYLAGNIGKPAIEILPRLNKNSLVVLELSSFQLQDLNPPIGKPDIAVVLNIFPDHLDVHKNFKEYLNAKANIVKNQNKTSKIFYFTGNKYSRRIAQKSPGEKIPIRIYSGHSNEFAVSNRDLKIPGAHNFKNAVMATKVALSLNCPKSVIINVIKKFKGNEHRLEFVRAIRIHSEHSDGFADSNRIINFYNDSAGTNPQTAEAAISAFKEPKILIAGGKDKKLDYTSLAKTLKNSNTKSVILFGENKQKIAKAILANSNRQIVIRKVKNLQQAVCLAYKTAKSLVAIGYPLVAVLFSPASASFDMFKNYKERGKKFKEIVKKIK